MSTFKPTLAHPCLAFLNSKSKFKLIGPNGVVPKSFRVTVACCMRGDFGDSGGLYKAVGGYRTSYGTQISMARDAIQRRQGHKKSRVSPIRNKLLQSQQMRFYLRFWCEPLLPTYLAGTYSFAVPCSKKVNLTTLWSRTEFQVYIFHVKFMLPCPIPVVTSTVRQPRLILPLHLLHTTRTFPLPTRNKNTFP